MEMKTILFLTKKKNINVCGYVTKETEIYMGIGYLYI